MDMTKKKVSILALDGGGIRGLMTTKILAYLESKLTGPLHSYFDIIAGTSTGGIIAMGLTVPVENSKSSLYTAKELIDIYRLNGSEIFSRSIKHSLLSGWGLFKAKYQTKGIEKVTYKYFKDAKLSKSLTNTLVLSYGINGDHPVYFKNVNALLDPEHWDYKLSKIAQATGAAPTFFPPVHITNDAGEKHLLVDGGIVRNNPAQSAVSYANELYPNATEYHLVSIGTGRTLTVTENSNGGAIKWLSNILEYMMDGSSQSTDYELTQTFKAMNNSAMSSNSSYYRLQPIIDSKDSTMDDYSKKNIKKLETYADNFIRDNVDMLDKLVNDLEKNNNNDNFKIE